MVIAIAIFSFMIALATAALNQGLKQYQHMMDKGINLWDAAKIWGVTKSFNAAIDYYVYTEGKNGFLFSWQSGIRLLRVTFLLPGDCRW